LVRTGTGPHFVNGDLWVVDLKSGQRQNLLSGFHMEHCNVSSDRKSIVFVTPDTEGHSPIWIAAIDGATAPRPLLLLTQFERYLDPVAMSFSLEESAGSRFSIESSRTAKSYKR
jgi:Tol biopolymer transport system component